MMYKTVNLPMGDLGVDFQKMSIGFGKPYVARINSTSALKSDLLLGDIVVELEIGSVKYSNPGVEFLLRKLDLTRDHPFRSVTVVEDSPAKGGETVYSNQAGQKAIDINVQRGAEITVSGDVGDDEFEAFLRGKYEDRNEALKHAAIHLKGDYRARNAFATALIRCGLVKYAIVNDKIPQLPLIDKIYGDVHGKAMTEVVRTGEKKFEDANKEFIATPFVQEFLKLYELLKGSRLVDDPFDFISTHLETMSMLAGWEALNRIFRDEHDPRAIGPFAGNDTKMIVSRGEELTFLEIAGLKDSFDKLEDGQTHELNNIKVTLPPVTSTATGEVKENQLYTATKSVVYRLELGPNHRGVDFMFAKGEGYPGEHEVTFPHNTEIILTKVDKHKEDGSGKAVPERQEGSLKAEYTLHGIIGPA